jgi:hypothetical protein
VSWVNVGDVEALATQPDSFFYLGDTFTQIRGVGVFCIEQEED